MIDRTTKAILAVIALGLLANAAIPLLRPMRVAAAEGVACTGELTPSLRGGTPVVVEGWAVSVQCK